MTSETSSSSDIVDQSSKINLKGSVLNNYNILYELGSGSYSVVWLAYNIDNRKYYAIKVQDPENYDEGIEEIEFVKKLPKDVNLYNTVIDSFISTMGDNKYLCSVWHLHALNIDTLLRKGKYTNGMPISMVKKIMRQLINSVYLLHIKFKVFHGDIKTDNILLKGLNLYDKHMINMYNSWNYHEKYKKMKEDYWVSDKKRSLASIDKMKSEDKLNIRKSAHKYIVDNMSSIDVDMRYQVDDSILDKCDISLADFGTWCDFNDSYEGAFGTRYYQAPEIILGGKCSSAVDIWALGCTFYELLTGQLLFDPNKDSKRSRDYYHLCLINDTCGDFSIDFLKKTDHYKKFFDRRLSDRKLSEGKLYLKEHEKEENRLERKLNNIQLDDINIVKTILNEMLCIDPKKRFTIEQLYNHSYF